MSEHDPRRQAVAELHRLSAPTLLSFVAAAALSGIGLVLLTAEVRDRVAHQLGEAPLHVMRTLMGEFLTTPWFYAVLLAVLLLERLVPANTAQGSFSLGLRQDLVWVPLKLVTLIWILPLYILILRFLFDQYLGFLRIDAVADWPRPARVLLALLWGDFLFWLIHMIRHKVPFFWRFHAVHHSQKELNFFTEYRVHPVDDLIGVTLGFIPILMVEHSFVILVGIVWFRHWHSRLCHSNLKLNLGPLRYVLVTPQSHRVHHSCRHEHIDRNFGLTFSLWDHLFGTQCRDYEVYPETGVDDDGFPFEQSGPSSGLVGNLLRQLAHPFRRTRGPSEG